jgi:RNA polymerase sigma factor (sigma-70 family)
VSTTDGPREPGGDASQRREYRPGSLDDFDRLYRDSRERVLRLLMGILGDASAAEDCLQETFVRALRIWSRWRPDDPAEAWLSRIAMKVAVPYRRRERLHALGERVRRIGSLKEATPLDDGAWSSDLLAALRRLPPNDAAIIVLRFGHGYANREIATALGEDEAAVASHLEAAKARLLIELGGKAPVAPGFETFEMDNGGS